MENPEENASEMQSNTERHSETSRLVTPNSTPKPSYINVVSNICALIFVGIIIYCCFKDGVSLFSFHPTLMALGVSVNHQVGTYLIAKFGEQLSKFDLINILMRFIHQIIYRIKYTKLDMIIFIIFLFSNHPSKRLPTFNFLILKPI